MQVNYTDFSGLLTVGINSVRSAKAQQHFMDYAIGMEDPEMVVIGGGGTASEDPGAFLTASYPNTNMTAWLVSSKDHLVPDAHYLTGYAIGLKLKGLPRHELFNRIRVFTASSMLMAHPEATVFMPWYKPDSSSPEVKSDWLFLGGGFKVQWAGQGNMGTACYLRMPGDGEGNDFGAWTARSKDHIESSPAAITVYAVAIQRLTGFGGRSFLRTDAFETSEEGNHPTATATLLSGWVLTGGGAEVQWAKTGGVGNMLWSLQPTMADPASPQGFTGKSKDHLQANPCKLTAWALGIRLI